MGVVATKLQESNVAESQSTSVTTLDVENVQKPKYKVKKPVALKKFYQGCVKKHVPAEAQTPLIKMNKGRKLLKFGHYHRLNEKLNQEVKEEDDKSIISTSSYDLDTQWDGMEAGHLRATCQVSSGLTFDQEASLETLTF